MPEMELDNDTKKRFRQLLSTVSRPTAAAKRIDVSYQTWRRWVTGESVPVPPMIRKIAQLEDELGIPGIADALREAFPSAFDPPRIVEVLNISAEYFDTVLRFRSTTASVLLQYTVHSYVYDCIVSQVDKSNAGLMLFFAQCASDSDGYVQFLTVTAGRGTALWNPNQVERAFQIGKDSLCGIATLSGEPAIYPYPQSTAHEIAPPLLHADRIQSAGAFPVTLCGDIAGVLFVASINVDFFTLAMRNLLRSYATMMSLGLRDDKFYSKDRIFFG